MCFVPVYFGLDKLARGKQNSGSSLEFTPVADTELPAQPTEDADATPGSDDFYISDVADNLELHSGSLAGV